MSTSFLHRYLAFALLTGLVLLSAPACESASSAPPPPTDSADKKSDSGTKKKKPKKDEDDSSADDEDSSALGGSKDADAKDTSGEKEPERSDYTLGGANVGTEDDKTNVKKCLDEKHFFDRFANDGNGNCTALPLAKMDCTESGIKAVLSEKQKTQFQDSMSGSYSGWSIDQCLDCPPGTGVDQCKSSAGVTQQGTKVFFVKEESSEIHGKAMVLPVRPAQDDAASSDTADKEDEGTTDGGGADGGGNNG